MPEAPIVDLPTTYQQFIYRSKYSRWRDDLNRRETWPETIRRYRDFFEPRSTAALSSARWTELEYAILRLDALPSMRSLWSAGPALERDQVAGYNCSFLTVSRPEAWDEMLYILMCGCGVGYSVEKKHVAKLPVVPMKMFVDAVRPIRVADSKIGWAVALRELITDLYAGVARTWDVSAVRPEGAILQTFGGRASGPEPFERLMRHIVDVFFKARGRRLTPLEAHGIATKIGDIVVVGGVRRAAMIALFSQSDREMLESKDGDWFAANPHFMMANNTQIFDDRPERPVFDRTFTMLADSGSGEPGVTNQTALRAQASRWSRRDPALDYGMNPCGEIILRDMQFCNLSSAIARPTDTLETLLRKQTAAVQFGVMQSTVTDFRHLDPAWQKNCEDERLLGVSIAGVADHPVLNLSQGRDDMKKWANVLRDNARRVAEGDANSLGISVPAAIGCLKPDGNTSQLTGAASPLKPWHDLKFVRRVRANKSDPVARVMADHGVPHEDEAWHPDTTYVFSFAQSAPPGAATRHDWTALEHLALWKAWRDEYCEHNPSVTINVRPDEWTGVAEFVWSNFNDVTGIAFLPHDDDDNTYVQAPYESIDDDEHAKLLAAMPAIDWRFLELYEQTDRTTGSQELACVSGVCET